MTDRPSARRNLLLILVPMLLTFSIQRVILHHSPPETHVYVSGFLVHHLFSGVLLLIPTSFLMALGTIRSDRGRALLTMLLGVSSSMVLDEVIFLVCTDGTGEAYRGKVSFWGAFTLMTLASGTLLVMYALASRKRDSSDPPPARSSVRGQD